MKRVILAVAMGLWAAMAYAAPATLHVAPGGNDAWSGRLSAPNAAHTDGPMASISGARDALRKLGTGGSVYLRGGVYRMGEPLVFRPEDSGVTYAAYQNERPILSGGRQITGWKPGPGKLWHAAVGEGYFQQLWVNGQRRPRARTPNEGYLHTAGRASVDREKRAFYYAPGDMKAWADLNDIVCVVYHSWVTSRLRIASVDERDRLVTFTGESHYPFEELKPRQRYYIENAPDALDAPGEWYLDRKAGELRYYPKPGEDMTKAEVVAPRLTRLVQLAGEPELGQYVEKVVFRGVTFSHEDYVLEPGGHSDGQAEITAPAAIMADGAKGCVLENCEISHVGDHAIWLRRGCRDNRIVHTRICDLGTGGVRIGESYPATPDVDESSGNVVDNCQIYDGGDVYDGAVGVWIAHSSRNVISHNEVHDFNYSGMSLGYNWDDAHTRTHDNVVEFNHIHHCLRGVLSDGAGIYTLGESTGTVIRGNVVHDIWPSETHPIGWGIYTDGTTSGCTVENNVVYNVRSGGLMFNNGAHECVYRNNVVALTDDTALWPYWPAKPNSFTCNIIYWTRGKLFGTWPWQVKGIADVLAGKGERGEWDHNLYFDTASPEIKFFGHSFAEWQGRGFDQHSIVADPQFVDGRVEPGTVTAAALALKPTSPAFKLGFKQIDFTRVGLYGDAAWVEEPKRLRYAPTVFPEPPPPPGPAPVDDGFETTPVGQRPADGTVIGEGLGASIRVSDEQAASGTHSLKLTDAAGLEAPWMPDLVYEPHFTKGAVREAFDLWLGKTAQIYTEWRDVTAYPGNVGPMVSFDGPTGNVSVLGKIVGQVPVGKWVHVETESRLGKGAAKTFTLTIGVPGEAPQVFRDLGYIGGDFSELHWLGFVSNATVGSVAYIDNVVIKTAAGP